MFQGTTAENAGMAGRAFVLVCRAIGEYEAVYGKGKRKKCKK